MGRDRQACGMVVALRPRRSPPRSVTPILALYDERGGASWLARALAGRRITCTGLIGTLPGGAGGWVAIAEEAVIPCHGCGGAHDWPAGLLLARMRDSPPAAAPFTTATVQGVLDMGPALEAPAGLGDRLILRDATFQATSGVPDR